MNKVTIQNFGEGVVIMREPSRTWSRPNDYVVRVNGEEVYRSGSLMEARYVARAALKRAEDRNRA